MALDASDNGLEDGAELAGPEGPSSTHTSAAALRRELSYKHVLDLDMMRAEYASQYGVPMIFLPEMG